MRAAVLLVNPKTPYNVGSALRGCAIFGADTLRWTGPRVLDPRQIDRLSRQQRERAKLMSGKGHGRLPREERLREYQCVDWRRTDDAHPIDAFISSGYTPVAVEVSDTSERLPDFVHPDRALYVFGPEDGSIPKGHRAACHRHVTIPSDGCLNLAAAVNVVLYDRLAKTR